MEILSGSAVGRSAPESAAWIRNDKSVVETPAAFDAEVPVDSQATHFAQGAGGGANFAAAKLQPTRRRLWIPFAPTTLLAGTTVPEPLPDGQASRSARRRCMFRTISCTRHASAVSGEGSSPTSSRRRRFSPYPLHPPLRVL